MLGEQHSDDSRGQILVLVALTFAIMIGVAAMAVDFGTYLVTQRYLMNAADGAALAGAAELGDPDDSTAQATSKGARQAALYLNENLDLGLNDAAIAELAGRVNQANGYCYPDPGDCSSARFQMWLFTPPPSTAATASAGLPDGVRTVYRDPRFPGRPRAMFVRVDQPGAVYFSRIFGYSSPVIYGEAVAAPSGQRCAVAALKPRLGTPDNKLSIELNSAQLYVGRGDVCSNYSIAWAGAGAIVQFTGGADQAVLLEEPGAMQGSSSVIGGTVDVLSERVEDPMYQFPLPGSGSSTVDRPPDAAFPSCVSAANLAASNVVCNASGWSGEPSAITLYPGKYRTVEIPDGKNVTLSRECFAGDTTCVPGVYWFQATSCGGPAGSGGIRLNGTSSGSSMEGQGVLLIFDPNETGGGCMEFSVTGNGARLRLNDSPNMRTTANPSGSIPFAWYNPSDTDALADPVTIWVRPNYVTGGNTYSVTSTPNNGSNVVKFNSGPLISESGLIYAPEDNARIAGNGSASGVGQVLSWTVTYSGAGSSLTQNFAGGASDRSRLIQ